MAEILDSIHRGLQAKPAAPQRWSHAGAAG